MKSQHAAERSVTRLDIVAQVRVCTHDRVAGKTEKQWCVWERRSCLKTSHLMCV